MSCEISTIDVEARRSVYPSALNMISNDIYLNTISSLNSALCTVEKLSQMSEPPVLTLENIEDLDGKHSKTVNFPKEIVETNVHTEIVNKNGYNLRSFFRLLRPSISVKKRVKKTADKETKSNSIGLAKKTKKSFSIRNAKMRSTRAIGVLNSSLDSTEFRLRGDANAFYRQNLSGKKMTFKSSFTSSISSSNNRNNGKEVFRITKNKY